MANSTEREQTRSQNNVQDVGLRRVSGQDASSVPGESGDRRLSFRAVRVHNSHLQKGKQTTLRCGVCEQGLESALAPIAVERVAEDEMVEGDGTNEGKDAAPSPRPWPGYSG